MILMVVGKSFEKDYDRAHTLLDRLPGTSDSFQAKTGGFILTFNDGTQEQVEKLQRHGLTASLTRTR